MVYGISNSFSSLFLLHAPVAQLILAPLFSSKEHKINVVAPNYPRTAQHSSPLANLRQSAKFPSLMRRKISRKKMANPAFLSTALKALFGSLGCLITATVIYTIATDGLPFRIELLTPWMAATLIDFYINVVVLGAWICYKESCGIIAAVWIMLLVCLGSITTCAYITWQLLKLSSQQSLQDPIYHVLLRHQNKDAVKQRTNCCSVILARVCFSAMGCLMLGTLLYTLLTDGSPFRTELFTPWMEATLIDFYINVIALLVWVAYKESTWTGAFIWIVLLICTGSIATCLYIAWQLFLLSPQDPVHLVLFNSADRSM